MKKRYLLIFSEPAHAPEKIAEVIKSSYKELFGEFGLASSGLKLVRGYGEKGIAILRCALDSLPKAILAAATITEINGSEVALRVIAVSGTIKGIMRRLSRVRSSYT